MAELNKLEQAKKVFATLCRTADKNEWHYEKDEDDLSIQCKARGDDLPMDVVVKVDAERMIIRLFSPLPFETHEDKRLDVAVAVSVINNRLANGCFDYNVTSGHIFFRITNSFIESEIGEDLIRYLLLVSFQTIDEYNDKLLMLATGMISIEKFLETAMG